MGGGSIRVVTKAAVLGGYRSAAAVRRAILPSSSSSSKPSSSTAAAADSRHASTFAADDWVIPDSEVFGRVPTHEEAMAATLDLRDAFEIAKVEPHVAHLDVSNTHLSPNDLDGPTKVAQDTALPDPVHPETSQDLVHSETSKHEDNNENLLVASGASGRVVQAFTMLQESPEAQDAVASLASDKNVWEAVMKNEKVLQFYKTKLSESSSLTQDEVEDSDAESVRSSNELSPSAGEAFKDYVEKMKAFVSEMVTNLSSIMQDLVATSNEGQCKGRLKTMFINSKNDSANSPSSFVLLAIASIMIVLLKRA